MTAFHFVFVFLGISFLKDNTENHTDKKTLLEEYSESCTEIERLKKELDQAVDEKNTTQQNKIRNELSHARKHWQRLLKKVKSTKT